MRGVKIENLFRFSTFSKGILMTTQVWIEPVKRLDGRNWYTDRNGLLLRIRLGGPHGEILCDRVHNAVCETCRVLMSRDSCWGQIILSLIKISTESQARSNQPSRSNQEHEPFRYCEVPAKDASAD
jgi:hypothetical protein